LVVLDATDNLQTRYLLNDACIKLGVPWVYSGVVGVCGVSLTLVPGDTACLRCLYPAMPDPGTTETCDVAGVLGPAAHAVASVAAAEAIKLIVGAPPSEGLLVADLWAGSWERFFVPRNDDCVACVHHRLEYLDDEGWAARYAARLCGRDAVQVRLPGGMLELAALAARLRSAGVGEVLDNPYLVRLRAGAHELTIFPDARVIVKGTEDASTARALVSRYIGT
jgi:adenylyltransferase/sulfurtransferase